MNKARIHIEGRRKEKLETARNRLMVAVFLFFGAFVLLGGRLVVLGVSGSGPAGPVDAATSANARDLTGRAEIHDRNGVVLATNLETWSLFADPARILDAGEAADRLASVLAGMSRGEIFERVSGTGRFVWLKRKMTPREVWRVNALGIPGIYFRKEEERIYPHGTLAAHVLGYTDTDGKGIAGIEHYFDARLADTARSGSPLRLSLDIRVQHALAEELGRAMDIFSAKGAAGIILDVKTGEILALASLPAFDPNQPAHASNDQKFNRATKGVYELGSIFKTFTVAQALETGAAGLETVYDASKPLRAARFLIHDDHPQNRPLTVAEIYAYSSNIGAAKMAAEMGTEAQQSFLADLGLLRPASIELTEVGQPMYPLRWREINTMTIGYGHGIAVSPLQLASAMGAMVNGGYLIPATLLEQKTETVPQGRRVLSAEVSETVRRLMRIAVTHGTAANADVPGYRVGGKTGTAEKSAAGGYQKDALVSSFAGAFPMDDPAYLVLVSVDEPKGIEATFNYATAGWVAAPTVKNIVHRIAPLLGVEPAPEKPSYAERISLLIQGDE